MSPGTSVPDAVVELEIELPSLKPQETEIKTTEMIKAELKELKYQNYLINFKDRIKAWEASHPNHIKPPIVYDSDSSDYIWLNRKLRRERR